MAKTKATPAKKPTRKTDPTKPKRRVGRPSSYTPELGEIICELVSQSDYGIEQVCKRPGLPSHQAVYRWLLNPSEVYDKFRVDYARAKQMQGHVQADRGIRDALNAKDASLGRLKWDARRWQAAKLAPRVYGEKLAHVGGGPDDEPIKFANLSEDELNARIAALAGAGGEAPGSTD